MAQNLIDSRAERRSKTRSSLLFIILATIPCYCLGFVVLRGCQPGQRPPTPTASLTYTLTAVETLTPSLTHTPPVFTLTASHTPTITLTWTPSLTLTPFSTWTRTITPTVTNTPEPPTPTDTLAPPTATSTTAAPPPPSVTPTLP